MTETAAKPRATPSAATSLTVRIAQRYGIDADKMLSTLKATAFRQRADHKTGIVREATNEEMLALLTIADRYNLDPFTRELFAFLDPKSGAIVPVVSVDGWIRIINDRPELRSISFVYSEGTRKHKGKTVHNWIDCAIARSDRDSPIVIREYFDEVVRDVTFATPWDSHPNRMHRHKTLIQAARVAFGFGGIYDEDEAHRILDGVATTVPEQAPALASINAAVKPPATPAIEHRPAEVVPPLVVPSVVVATAPERVPAPQPPAEAAAPAMRESTDDDAFADAVARTLEPGGQPGAAGGEHAGPSFAEVADAMRKAKDDDAFAFAVDLIRSVADPAHRVELERIAAEIRNGGA